MPEYEARHHRHQRRDHEKRHKSGWEMTISGLVIGAGFGIVWATHPDGWWWVFPMVFGGVLPFFKGVQQLISERKSKSPAQRQVLLERQILTLARDSRGTVTPAMVALASEISTETAEEILEKMAKKGYASMEVTGDGRIEFRFPEFLPPK